MEKPGQQDGNDAKEIHTTAFLDEKINYIHQNPVRLEIVADPEEYLYSSARDYSGEKGLVPRMQDRICLISTI